MDKAVIRINIDSEEFDRFAERFNKYRDSVETLPAQWADQNEQVERTVASMTKLAELSKTEKKALDPRIEKNDKEKTARLKADEKSWARIEKHTEKVGKEVSGLARMTIGIASGGRLGSLGAGLGVAGAFIALYGAIEAAGKNLAALNLQGRALNLAPGQAAAFTTAYSGIGASEGMLSKLASAKMDSTQWHSLIAAGLTPQEIESENPIELSEKLIRGVHAGDASRTPLQAGQWRRGTGISDFIDDATANRISSYSDDDLDKMHNEYVADVPRFARDQKDADAGTGLKNHLAENWADISKSFDHAAILLAPQLEAWSDAATKLSKDVLEKLPGWLKTAEDYYEKDIAPVMPKLGTGGDKLDDAAIDVARTVGDKNKWKDLWNGVKSSGIKSGGTSLKPAWDWDHPFGTWDHRDTSADAAGGDDPRHNPGNMRIPGSKTFQQYRTDAEGVRAVDRQLQLYNHRDKISTIDGILNKYAPQSDGNDTRGYAKFVSERTGFKTNEPLDMDDPSVRAKIESAIFQMETSKHHDLTPERVQAMYDLNFTDAPKAAPGGDNALAVKAASGEAQDMTIYAENDPALAAHAETGRVLKKIASQRIDPQIIQIDSDGSDSKMPPILQRPPGQGAFPANQNINVKVSAPAGSSVAVTSSNFPG